MTDPTAYAVALADSGALFSQRAHPLATVICGALRRDDMVEIVRPDGSKRLATISSVPGKALSAADHDGQITFADLDREDLGPGDIIRTPGLKAPPLSLDGPGGLHRLNLLHSVKVARRSGFATTYAKLLSHLPDEAVVLFLEKAVRDALRPPKSPHNIRTAFEKAALLYQAMGLCEDGDRLRLAAAALLEGRPLGWTLMALTSSVVSEMMAEQGAKAAEQTLGGAGWTLHAKLEGVSAEYKREFAAQGEAVRQDLQQRGRAIGVGWCGKCKDVVRLDQRLRCARGHGQIKDTRVVVPSEVAETERALRRRHH